MGAEVEMGYMVDLGIRRVNVEDGIDWKRSDWEGR
jgi:hypothetical protein